MSQTPLDPSGVVDDYHRAWTTGHLDQAMDRVAPDARFAAPGGEVTTRDEWRAYLAGFQPALTAVVEHARLAGADRVALWYFPQTATTSTALACELFTVRDGRITDIRLVFDRLSYAPPPR